MRNNKMTGWFGSDVKPALPGVYEVEGRFFSKWDGKDWFWGSFDLEAAAESSGVKEKVHYKKWRGLAEKP